MSKMLQRDIFGNEIAVEELAYATNEISNKKKGIIPMKTRFRAIYGYKEGFKCKNCKFLTNHRYRNNYYKCEKLGATGSPASDIRLKDVACNLYEEAEND